MQKCVANGTDMKIIMNEKISSLSNQQKDNTIETKQSILTIDSFFFI